MAQVPRSALALLSAMQHASTLQVSNNNLTKDVS